MFSFRLPQFFNAGHDGFNGILLTVLQLARRWEFALTFFITWRSWLYHWQILKENVGVGGLNFSVGENERSSGREYIAPEYCSLRLGLSTSILSGPYFIMVRGVSRCSILTKFWSKFFSFWLIMFLFGVLDGTAKGVSGYFFVNILSCLVFCFFSFWFVAF